MSVENRLKELSARHQKLDLELTEEQKRPVGDTMKIARLKREKLKLKDEIRSMSARMPASKSELKKAS